VANFSACFLLVFGQLAVGGFAALAVPPFAVLERGFYKSSAGVFLASALVYVIGRARLAAGGGAMTAGTLLELMLWLAFAVAASLYLASLWGDVSARRARAFVSSLFLGVIALSVSASRYRVGPLVSFATVLYPLAFLTGALALGAVATGMLLGHWYLIDLGLSIEPMRRLFRYFVTTVVLHLVVLALTIAIMALGPGDATAAVGTLWHDHGPLLAARITLGPLAVLVLAVMIHRTLQIPQTMAATGLFYIAILFVLVGELLGRLILFRTSLPL
jgi:hypothetical protein